jgi:lipid-A-disaccharide synthase
MTHADALIVASGTATLEAAIAGTPMVIVYRISPLSYRIAKALVKLPYVGLVNIVAGRRIVPEFLQSECRPGPVADGVSELIKDNGARQTMVEALREVSGRMGEPGAADRAASAVLEIIDSKDGSL